MKKRNKTQQNASLFYNFKANILTLTFVVLVIFVLAQLVSLGFFGTKGVEVSQVRKEQQELITENEILKAKIHELQSLNRIKDIATNDFGMVKADKIDYISPNDNVTSNLVVSE